MPFCFKCGFQFREGTHFCPKCGTQVKPYCLYCGKEVPSETIFCPHCGKTLMSEERTGLSIGKPSYKRRTVIVVSAFLILFLAIVGSFMTQPKTPPTASNLGISLTDAGFSTIFSAQMKDAMGLSKYIFSFDNGIGEFSNSSARSFSGNPGWANETEILTSTVGATVRYQWFFNNTYNIWSSTDVQSFVTTAAKPLNEFLPTRQDLSSEWIIGNDVKNVSLNAVGFSDSVGNNFVMMREINEGFVVKVYRFFSEADANTYYKSVVADWQNKGGYSEISTGLNVKSYGMKFETAMHDVIIIYAVKKNICVQVEGMAISLIEDDPVLLANIVINKI